MKIFGIKTCDTCRKARKALPDATFVDIRETPLSESEILSFFEAFGDALLNRKSTTWRGLSEAEHEQDPVVLLQAHPTLMKRPVIATEGAMHLGWTAEVQAALV